MIQTGGSKFSKNEKQDWVGKGKDINQQAETTDNCQMIKKEGQYRRDDMKTGIKGNALENLHINSYLWIIKMWVNYCQTNK